MTQSISKKSLVGMLVAAVMCIALLGIVVPQEAHAAQGWNSDSKGFWYQYDSNSKHYYKNGWKKIDGEWFYFQRNGYAKEGWLKDGKYWYYLYGDISIDTAFGSGDADINSPRVAKLKDGKYHYTPYMLTGPAPIKIGNKWYSFDKSGRMKTGWIKVTSYGNVTFDNSIWYYANSNGALAKGWKKVSGKWYYFREPAYYMATEEWRDGYWLGKSGAWTYKHKGSWHKDSKGWWFGDTSGWYAKNELVAIDGQGYVFDSEGYWVNDGAIYSV